MRLKIIFILLVLAALFPVNFLPAESEPKCLHIKRLLDRYASMLPWGSDPRYAEMSLKAEEIAAEIHKIMLPKDQTDKTESLISKLKACRQMPLSARFGMAGYLTDLRYRMKQDPAIKEQCGDTESLYDEVLRECAGAG